MLNNNAYAVRSATAVFSDGVAVHPQHGHRDFIIDDRKRIWRDKPLLGGVHVMLIAVEDTPSKLWVYEGSQRQPVAQCREPKLVPSSRGDVLLGPSLPLPRASVLYIHAICISFIRMQLQPVFHCSSLNTLDRGSVRKIPVILSLPLQSVFHCSSVNALDPGSGRKITAFDMYGHFTPES